jgi:hypothetical protein
MDDHRLRIGMCVLLGLGLSRAIACKCQLEAEGEPHRYSPAFWCRASQSRARDGTQRVSPQYAQTYRSGMVLSW